MILGLIILIFFQLIGELIARVLLLPIPGAVLGMVFLFITLLKFRSLYSHLGASAHFLMRWMSLFFIPAGVGVVALLDKVKSEAVPLFLVLTLGTMITLWVTALTFHYFKRSLK